MLENENNCHSEPNLQRLTYEESQNSKEILRMQFQRSCSQNDTALVGEDSISAQNRGITLIALVVTLVVLLILAGITISVVLSEGGIIAKAQSSKEKQEVAVWLDRLTVTEANTAVTHYAVDLEKYNAELKAEGIVLENDSNYQSEDGGETYNLTTDNGYVFNISEPTPGDIVINYIGKNGELLPYIKEIKVISTTTNSSKIEVEVARLEDGKLIYEYKKHAEESYALLKESKELTANFTGLIQKETYDIKVTAENKNGKSEAKIISIYTGKLEEGTISQKGSTAWSAGTASVELQTTDTTNTLQYQKNAIAGTWTNYGAAITGLVHGDMIYARMYDGINGSEAFSINIMDGVVPTVTETSSNATTNSVSLAVTAVDNESGMLASPTYTFYRKISTEADSSYIKDQEGTSNSYTKTGLLQNTTYTIKVETKDKANNIGSVTKNITTSGVGGATGGLTGGNVIASNPTWSSGTASITLSTSTGFTLQWQKNAINSSGWTIGTSVTGLNHGDTVYARLTDGTNYGDSASVSILDTVIPQNATISLSSSTTKEGTPITATVTQIDNESGVNITSGKWVYNNTSGLIGTAESSYTGGAFSSNPQTITLNATTAGTYYLHVLTMDKAGNAIETVSSAVTVRIINIANVPKLGNGMIPIKWNGNSWINTTTSDGDWYDYSETAKKWANAKTSDGSMWVWIPRYAYQITDGYHQSGRDINSSDGTLGAGNIKIKFLKDISNTAADGTNSWNNSSGQGNWNIHPAFDYGQQVSGIWIAKFEASNTNCTTLESTGRYNGTDRIMQVKPGITSWREITPNNIYTVCLNYNVALNSHMMKNSEWGAVAYLTQSNYGKNSKVWINNSSSYITGAAGNSVSANTDTGTTSDYTNSQGVQASTTGNVTGIYDMSGGAWEQLATYINNGNSSLTNYGASLKNGAAKTKDVYNYNSSADNATNNYIGNSNRYGDALWETSSNGSIANGAWYNEVSRFFAGGGVFLRRGGYCKDSSGAGLFYFECNGGTYPSGGYERLRFPSGSCSFIR